MTPLEWCFLTKLLRSGDLPPAAGRSLAKLVARENRPTPLAISRGFGGPIISEREATRGEWVQGGAGFGVSGRGRKERYSGFPRESGSAELLRARASERPGFWEARRAMSRKGQPCTSRRVNACPAWSRVPS